MIGLVILFILLMYALFSACVIYAGGKLAGWLGYDAKLAKKRIKIIWFAPVLLWLVWDLPTIPLHKYYCATQAGFFVYKTPEQWLKEHPRVIETLKESLSPTRLGIEKPSNEVTWVNQRFYIKTTRIVKLNSLHETRSEFFDAESGELIAKSTNFWRGKHGNVFSLGGNLEDLRQAVILGWGNRQCSVDGASPVDIFNQFIYQFWKSGEHK